MPRTSSSRRMRCSSPSTVVSAPESPHGMRLHVERDDASRPQSALLSARDVGDAWRPSRGPPPERVSQVAGVQAERVAEVLEAERPLVIPSGHVGEGCAMPSAVRRGHEPAARRYTEPEIVHHRLQNRRHESPLWPGDTVTRDALSHRTLPPHGARPEIARGCGPDSRCLIGWRGEAVVTRRSDPASPRVLTRGSQRHLVATRESGGVPPARSPGI
jgi:hypothetical protein